MRLLCAVLVLLMLRAGAAAETFVAKVVTVMDGDTLMVMRGHKKITLRLAGIDAPEKLQEHGVVSRDALAALVLNKDVQVSTKAADDYGRIVAVVEVGRINVSEDLLRRGMAWENSQYHSNKTMMALQADAQHARRGLWARANPLPPWAFRKTHAPVREHEHGRRATNDICGKKHYCSQMVSCEEARFYLKQCRVKTLDKDGDGVPCENLCDIKAR